MGDKSNARTNTNLHLMKDTEKVIKPTVEGLGTTPQPLTEEQRQIPKDTHSEVSYDEFMKIIPKGLKTIKDRLIVAVVKSQPKKPSQIINPNTQQPMMMGEFIDHPWQGIVIVVGPGTQEDPIKDLKQGDLVYLEDIPSTLNLSKMYITDGYFYFSTRYSNVVCYEQDRKKIVNKKIVLNKATLNQS